MAYSVLTTGILDPDLAKRVNTAVDNLIVAAVASGRAEEKWNTTGTPDQHDDYRRKLDTCLDRHAELMVLLAEVVTNA